MLGCTMYARIGISAGTWTSRLLVTFSSLDEFSTSRNTNASNGIFLQELH